MPDLDSFTIIIGGAVLLVSAILTIGAIYFGGGTIAVKRQVPQIAALLLAIALVIFVLDPILTDKFGLAVIGALGLGLSALVWIGGRRRQGTTFPIRTQTGRTMTRRMFVALWLGIAGFFIVLSIVLAIAMRPAS